MLRLGSTRAKLGPVIKVKESRTSQRSPSFSLNYQYSTSTNPKEKKLPFHKIKSLQEKAKQEVKGKIDLKFLPKKKKEKPLHISQGDGLPIHFRTSELPYDGAPVDKSRRLIERRGRYCKLLSINRPQHNNAIDLTAANVILQEFRELNVFPGVQAVVLTGAGETAFSSGVDWKEILQNKPADARKLLREDSKLAFFLSTCSLRNVSVVRGYASGSGITMSAFNDYCIATYGTRCDWPETSFGMCPSAGNSFVLSRLNAKYRGLGTYVGLTGTMIRGEDVLATAIANDFGGDYAPVQLIEAFSANHVWNSGSFAESIEGAIGVNNVPELSFVEHLGAIHRCFHLPNSVEEIFEALETENSEWSKATLEKLKQRSPLALKVTFHQIWKAGDLDLPGCFQMDFRLVNRLMREQDFKAAASTRFGNNDANSSLDSVWRFKSVSEVPEELVNSMFEPLTLERDGTCDLILPDEVYLEHPTIHQLKMVKNMGRVKVQELPGISAKDIAEDYIMEPPSRMLPEPLSPLQELQENLDGRPLGKVANDAKRYIENYGVKLDTKEIGPYVRMMALELGFERKYVLRDEWPKIWLRLEEHAFKHGFDLKDLVCERDVQTFIQEVKAERAAKKQAAGKVADVEENAEEAEDEETAAQVQAQLRTEEDNLEYDDEDVDIESGRDLELEKSLNEQEKQNNSDNNNNHNNNNNTSSK